MELFIGPSKQQHFDSDGTIPSYHLHNFEHANISLTFFVYPSFSILFDKIIPSTSAQNGLTLFLGAVAFGQEFLLFHLHSTDHMGVEGQYHWLLQVSCFGLQNSSQKVAISTLKKGIKWLDVITRKHLKEQIFRENIEYLSLISKFEKEDLFEDVEAQKKSLVNHIGEQKRFVEKGKKENN
ncbi:hypothetical protein H5410_001901 [Solanum commersonii]|uniref:Uncharacterized protein n=1 Tax=Solanum commersonii TaxID=4109 RepID=A0A9J6B0E1_SOLCO|nr:hypothetical protein H5410_001901 [Solanum commersonii]